MLGVKGRTGESPTKVQRAKARCFESFEDKFKGHNLAENQQPDWFGRTFPVLDSAICLSQDVHEIDVHFVTERDEKVNPLGVKGLGEIGVVGAAAAIANAVRHATGRRIAQLPITIDKTLAGL